MFHSAALKLTTWYLAIIMALSIGCSLAIYHFSSREIGNNAAGQTFFLNNDLAPPVFQDFRTFRTQQADTSRGRLKNDLIVFNLLVLVGGGILSYALARRTLEPIEEALESQKRFASDASHELRTPLAAMQSETEVALRDPKLTKAGAVAMLQSNLEEVAKLRDLSEGLLKLANQSGKASFDQAVSLKDAAMQACERLDKAAQAKKISLNRALKDVSVRGDQQNVTDLAAILLDNAIKYSPGGSQINVATGRRNKQGFIKVSDRGRGIQPADLPHIFDRFYRADASRTKNQSDGYGLGLALAKKIVDSHGGHIDVQSTPGKGSTFTAYLPLA